MIKEQFDIQRIITKLILLVRNQQRILKKLGMESTKNNVVHIMLEEHRRLNRDKDEDFGSDSSDSDHDHPELEMSKLS